MSYEFSEEEHDLWQTIDLASGRDKAEALARLAELKLTESKYAEAETFAAESVSLYRTVGDGHGIGEGLFLEGRALRGLKNPAQALPRFEESAEVFRASSNQFFLSMVVSEMAQCYKDLEQWNLAVNTFDNATVLFASSENWENAGLTALESAECSLEVSDYLAAEMRSSQGYEYLAKNENPFFVANALSIRAKTQVGQGNYGAAIDDLTESLHIMKYFNYLKLVAEIQTDLVWAYICNGQLEQARSLLAEARQIHTDGRGVPGLAECDYLEAWLAKEAGDFDSAAGLFESCRAAFRALNNKQRTFDSDYQLALCLSYVDSYKAAKAFEGTIQRAEQSGLILRDHKIFVDLAEVYVELAWTESALSTLEKVDVDLLGSQGERARMVLLRSQVHLKQRSFIKCIDELQFVLGINALPANQETLLQARETLGRAYFGDQQYALAIESLTPVLLELTLADQTEEAKEIAELIQEAKHGLQTQQLANQPQLWEEDK